MSTSLVSLEHRFLRLSQSPRPYSDSTNSFRGTGGAQVPNMLIFSLFPLSAAAPLAKSVPLSI